MTRVSMGVAATGLAVMALVVGLWANSQTADSTITQAQAATSSNPGRLVVHEWGTFTSFAGSNGVQLEFRPLLDSDLPGFVLTRELQAGARSVFAKASIWAPLRMETPVTYFYVDEPRQVRVKVDFPGGLLTEFYPPVRSMQPEYSKMRPETLGPSQLDWGEITLIPRSALQPQLGDDALSQALAARLMAAAPPADFGRFHYTAARETDSALVAVHLPKPEASNPTMLPPPSGLHVEKFLFYRGVGKFDLPLQAEFQDDGRVKVINLGDEPIKSLFLIDVTQRSDELRILRAHIAELKPQGETVMPARSQSVSLGELGLEIQEALEQEGLFAKEAAAMVRTWSDSWFQEQGLRLFYVVPRGVTDRVLPLEIEPTPDETVRVLVGRMELLPPEREASLASAVSQHRQTRERQAGENPNSSLPVPQFVKQLGRFAEPALVRVRELASDEADAQEATNLLRQLRAQD